MKQVLLVFMVIGIASAISATPPKYVNERNIKPADRQENCSSQMTFILSLDNQGSVKFDITLTNTLTGIPYSTYTVNSDTVVHETIEAGTYDIQITPETMPADHFAQGEAGCYPFDGYMGSTAPIYLYNVALNSGGCSSYYILNGSVIK